MKLPIDVFNTDLMRQNNKPRPMLSLDPQTCETIAVDFKGQFICGLWGPVSDGVAAYHGSKEKLVEQGWDTTWAKWDDKGRFAGWVWR